jgi:hypothetical protein
MYIQAVIKKWEDNIVVVKVHFYDYRSIGTGRHVTRRKTGTFSGEKEESIGWTKKINRLLQITPTPFLVTS